MIYVSLRAHHTLTYQSLRSEFDLTNSMMTSVNSAHAQCYNTTHKVQRVVYNMAVEKHFYYCSICLSYKVLFTNADVILKFFNKISSSHAILHGKIKFWLKKIRGRGGVLSLSESNKAKQPWVPTVEAKGGGGCR